MTSSNDALEIGEDSEVLADVWTMKDPHHITSQVFRSHGPFEGMSVKLEAGQVTSHQMPISVNHDDDSFGEVDICITDIQVRVSLDHSCLKGIEYIKLTAPGTKDVADHDAPQSRDYETKVRMCLRLCL